MDYALDLLALPLPARRDLLKVLTWDSRVRAEVIRQLHERGKDDMVDLLVELEADDQLRRQANQLRGLDASDVIWDRIRRDH